MKNQEITTAVVAKLKSGTFSQDQLAQLFESSKEFLVSNNPYEVYESRTYIDDNVKMLVIKRRVFNQETEYSYFINQFFNS